MAWSDARRTFTMRLANGSRMFGPTKRNIEVKAGGVTKAVLFEGRPVTVGF